MPLYDYHCVTCDKVSELLLSASSKATCPLCGSDAVERLISAPAAPGRSGALVNSARAMAAREGHFSNYARSERPRR